MTAVNITPSVPGELRILAFGSSLVEGYTDFGSRFHPYAIALEKKLTSMLPSTTIKIDVNGQSGDRVLSRLRGMFLQRLQVSVPLRSKTRPPKYDVVIILGGTNDLGTLVAHKGCETEIFEGIKECYEHVLRARSTLVAMTVPERSVDLLENRIGKQARESREKFNEKIKEFAEGHESVEDDDPKVLMMDLARLVPFPKTGDDVGAQGVKIWSRDGLHMNAEGYDFVGEELAVFIYNLLKTGTEASGQINTLAEV